MVLSMERWKGKVAVVTGASEGIGAATAQALVKEGVIVVGFARNKEKLEELSCTLKDPSKFHPVKVDVTKEQDILDGFQWIRENLGSVHILVNSAGILRGGNFSTVTYESLREIFDTNVLGLCMVTREALKSFEQNKVDGHVVHINSLEGHRVHHVPVINVYPASKFAVTALTETLRQELNFKNSKTKVTSISPSYVKTNFSVNSGIPLNEKAKEMLRTYPGLVPEDIADAVVYVLSTPPHVQVHELVVRPVGDKT